MRSFVSSLLEVAGAAAVAVGAGLMWFPAGVVVGGGLLMLFGYQSGGEG
jgi:hypothetical protein